MVFGEVSPEQAGFDEGRLAEACDLVREGLQRELYTGAAFWASGKGVTAVSCCVGHTDESRVTPVDEHTLFDLASLTKPVATATAVLMLAGEGRSDLTQRVGELLPGCETEHLQDVTLFQLLTHTSGLPAWRDLYGDQGTREHALDVLLSVPLEAEPGAKYQYSCLGYILLGLVVEAVSGERLDVFARKRIFEPLNMRETVFGVGRRENIACTGFCPRRGRLLVGEVHDLNSCAFGGISGNAGLFSSVQDMATFCHSVTIVRNSKEDLPPGLANRYRIFANALPFDVGGHTLGGWFIWPNPLLPAGGLVTKATVGHSGFTGTAILVDPVNEVCSVLLTNRVCRPDDGTEFRALRRRVFDALLGAIVW